MTDRALRITIYAPQGTFVGKAMIKDEEKERTMEMMNAVNEALSATIPLEDGTVMHMNKDMIGQCLFVLGEEDVAD